MGETSNKRIEWLDVARAIAMFLVVLGHSIVTPVREHNKYAMLVYDSIYSFHMPLWLLLSGYSLKLSLARKSIKQVLKNKAKQLIIPYFGYAVFVYVLFMLLSKIPFLGNMLPGGMIPAKIYLLNMLVGKNEYSIHLWYIYVLFVYYLAVVAIIKLSNKIKVPARVGLLISAIVVLLVRRTLYVNGPEIICTYLMPMYSYFIIGVCFDLDKISRRNLKILGVIFILLSYIMRQFNLVGASRIVTATYYILKNIKTIAFIICLCGVFKYLTNRMSLYFKKKMNYISSRCMDIYIWHLPFCTTCVGAVLYKIIPDLTVVIIIITCIIGIVVPIVISNIIYKIKRR